MNGVRHVNLADLGHSFHLVEELRCEVLQTVNADPSQHMHAGTLFNRT